MRWKVETKQGIEYALMTLCVPDSSAHVAAVVEILTRAGVNGPQQIVITQEPGDFENLPVYGS